MPPKKTKEFKYTGLISVLLFPSTRSAKKYEARYYEDGVHLKSVHFGQASAEDYTIHNDDEKKKNYIARHKPAEEVLWSADPFAPATLSRFVLWEYPDIQTAWNNYKTRFNLQ